MFSSLDRTIQINVNIRLLFKSLLFSLLRYRNSRLVLFWFEAGKIWPQVKQIIKFGRIFLKISLSMEN